MQVVDFETAKCLAEKLNIYRWENCYYLYAKDNNKLINWSSIEADYYLKNNNRFYPAPFIQEVIEYIENSTNWRIYVTPRFDGFDNAQIDTYFEIYKYAEASGHDYSSDAHVGSRYESINRAIREVCNLIINERNNGIYN